MGRIMIERHGEFSRLGQGNAGVGTGLGIELNAADTAIIQADFADVSRHRGENQIPRVDRIGAHQCRR